MVGSRLPPGLEPRRRINPRFTHLVSLSGQSFGSRAGAWKQWERLPAENEAQLATGWAELWVLQIRCRVGIEFTPLWSRLV